MHTHPGKALCSRPGCPGAGRYCCRQGRLGQRAGAGRLREARPMGPQLREQGPQGPQSRCLAAGQGHSPYALALAGSGPRQGEPLGEGPRPRRPGADSGFRLHRRQGSQPRGTMASRPPALQEAAGKLVKSEEQRGRGLDGDPQHTGAGSGRERNTDRADRRRARWKASRAAGLGNAFPPETCTLSVRI